MNSNKYLNQKRTKMVVTIGPSSNNYEVMKELVLNGATTIRANFSHADYAEQKQKFDIAKKVREDLNLPLSIMLDTKGPEIRVGKLLNGGVQINTNQTIKLYSSMEKFANFEGNENEFAISHTLHNDAKVGDKILFDDGKLTSVIESIEDDEITVRTLNSHFLKTNKRINVPGVEISMEFLSPKDIEDIKFGIEQGIDYVAASFVSNAEELKDLRKLLDKNDGEHIQIISKIESAVGIKNLDEIIEYSDGIMVARGDLGLEIPYFEVPFWEKRMIRKCRIANKPVIVATQMLDSMEKTPQPTRAEVSDVYWATELGADSTMLSGESANGNFPIESVQVMSNINLRAEKEFYNKLYYPSQLRIAIENIKSANALLAANIALKVMDGNYKFAIVMSKDGNLLKELSRLRPNTAIIGVVNKEELIHAFGVNHSISIYASSLNVFDEINKNVKNARQVLMPYDAQQGDKFIVVTDNEITELEY